MGFLSLLQSSILHNFLWFAGMYTLFGLLAVWLPAKIGQKHWRADMWTDVLYWFAMPPFYMVIRTFMVMFVFLLIFAGDPAAYDQAIKHGFGPLSRLPLWVQIPLILLIGDFLQYGLHRWMHTSIPAWRYHAIHHSAREIDWLTSARFHPVNYILFTFATSLTPLFLGFAPEAFVLMGPFNILFSSLVHANVNWSFGPLNPLLASPRFHRWHHTLLAEGGNKNFAPTFPFIDILFGSYYMPKDKKPEVFGIEDNPVPQDFLGQLIYPFRK